MVTFIVDERANQKRATKRLQIQEGFVAIQNSIVRLVKGLKPEAVGANSETVCGTWANSFIDTLDYAYRDHYPLTLSPDDVWMTLAQSFALHVDQNAEKLRKMFVAHEGKVKINVQLAKAGQPKQINH